MEYQGANPGGGLRGDRGKDPREHRGCAGRRQERAAGSSSCGGADRDRTNQRGDELAIAHFIVGAFLMLDGGRDEPLDGVPEIVDLVRSPTSFDLRQLTTQFATARRNSSRLSALAASRPSPVRKKNRDMVRPAPWAVEPNVSAIALPLAGLGAPETLSDSTQPDRARSAARSQSRHSRVAGTARSRASGIDRAHCWQVPNVPAASRAWAASISSST